MGLTISELAKLVDGELLGSGDTEISSVGALDTAGPDQIAFVADESAARIAPSTRAGCIIIPQGADLSFECPTIAVRSPKFAFAKIGEVLHPGKFRPAGIHPSAVVAEDAVIGEEVFIGAFCTVGEGSEIGSGTHVLSGSNIGDGVSIGQDCRIHPNVSIEDGCRIGSRVVIKSAAVIGSKGFGFVREGDQLIKFPQIGTLVIEDDVEIGAGTCVDRGALGETRIGAGTKIDNLVQVAHNVTIGKRVVIAALSGISGSTVIGDDCVVGGQVGFADHAEIESGAVIGAKSAVFPGKKVKKGVWAGIPVMPLNEYKRLNAHIKSIPRLKAEVRDLKGLLGKLEALFRKR